MDNGRQILVLNAGSSSLKLGLFSWDDERQLAEKAIDWNQDAGHGVSGHDAALRHLLEGIDLEPIAAAGNRVVHGGARYSSSIRIDAAVKAEIERLSRLAPLHNPPALATINAVEALMPGVPQAAVFDTAFHSTMAPAEYLYPLPYSWYSDWGVRRFGFHGLSHAYCAARAAELLHRSAEGLRLVICHLGSGCSLSAVVDGRSVATTMGFTPLDGVMMGTRSGSLDPGILTYLIEQDLVKADQLATSLTYQAGLKGISGTSNDMRTLLAARDSGDSRAALALEMFCTSVRHSIGAMTAAAGGIDALVFTAGIGENARPIRAEIVEHLGWLGVELDSAANDSARPDADIALASSRVRVLAIHTREDLVVARETRRLLTAASPGS